MGYSRSAKRFFDRADRADVHGRSGAAHRVRERRESPHRARLHAAEGNRGAVVARMRRAHGSFVNCSSKVSCCRSSAAALGLDLAFAADARPARTRAVGRTTAAGHARSPIGGSCVHAGPSRSHRHHLRTVAGAAGQPPRPVDHAERHGGINCRHWRLAVPAQGSRHGAGCAQLSPAVRRGALRPQSAEPEGPPIPASRSTTC